MSNFYSQECKERLYEEILESLLPLIPEDLTDQEIDALEAEAMEKLQDEYYFSYEGHPSLTVQERNR